MHALARISYAPGSLTRHCPYARPPRASPSDARFRRITRGQLCNVGGEYVMTKVERKARQSAVLWTQNPAVPALSQDGTNKEYGRLICRRAYARRPRRRGSADNESADRRW